MAPHGLAPQFVRGDFNFPCRISTPPPWVFGRYSLCGALPTGTHSSWWHFATPQCTHLGSGMEHPSLFDDLLVDINIWSLLLKA